MTTVASIGAAAVAGYTDTYRIRTISSSGIISTVAGNGSFASPGDNSPALGAIPVAKGLASDPSGALYISDNIRIRKISGGILSYYAGTGNSGYNGDGLTPSATQLDNPSALASDAFGNLYFIDGYRIRKISGGTVSTIGGNQHSD